MDNTELQTIMDCLPKGKTKFYYFKDRYAQMLLSYFVGNGEPVNQIKKTNYSRLLNKNLIKRLTEQAGDGMLTPALLNSVWPREYECYLLTLGKWGKDSRWIDSYYQTTRCGYNLVLQLNFSGKHNLPYYQLVQPLTGHPFECTTHPVADQQEYRTLAWSRLDINLDDGQALIEEVQNDWIRNAVSLKRYVQRFIKRQTQRSWADSYLAEGLGCRPEQIVEYVDRILTDHIQLWDEAMLTATIWFLAEELGIKTIYYHTFDTGNKLKSLSRSYCKPPRSLYTTLPKKFCFEKTRTAPDWTLKNRKRTRSLKKIDNLDFWRLKL